MWCYCYTLNIFFCVFLLLDLHSFLNAFVVFPRQIGDMSLADSATMCLSAVITQLSEVGCPEAEYKEIVQYTILDAIRKGLKSKIEVTSNMLAYISTSLLYISHLFIFIFFFTECTKWLHYGSGLPGEDLPKPIRVSWSGAADGLLWSRVRFLWAYEAHTGKTDIHKKREMHKKYIIKRKIVSNLFTEK